MEWFYFIAGLIIFFAGFVMGAISMNKKCAKDIESAFEDNFPHIDFENALKNNKPIKIEKYETKIK